MKAPSTLKIWLCDCGPIYGLSVARYPKGTCGDEEVTKVTLKAHNGKRVISLKTCIDLLVVGICSDSVARPKLWVVQEVAAFRKYQKEHASDLAELDRLKAKLGV